MPRVQLTLATGFYSSQSKPLIDKRLVNMFPVIPQAEAANQRALFSTPGTKQFSTVTGSSSRGSIVFTDGIPYFVVGNNLYSFDSLGASTDHGTISGTSDVSMSSNGINIAIQDPNGDSYFFTPSTNTLELNNSAAFLSFGQAETVTFKDGFYVYTTFDKFFVGSTKTVNDGKTFNALDFLDAEISPDRIIKGHNNHNQLYMMGETTGEVFQSRETSGFPFIRIRNAVIQKGCIAPNSVMDFDNGFVFMGGDVGERPSIYKAIGSSVQKISTSSVDQMMHESTEAELKAARAFAYAEDGNYYAVFTVGDNTFVYDATTSALAGTPQWHQRQTGIGNGDNFFRWRAIHGVLAFNKILIGDDRTGKIGELDNDIFTEYGDRIERVISTQPFIQQGMAIFSSEIELFMETGLGNADDPNPMIRMDYSDDGSKTYSSELFRPVGKVGEFRQKIKWPRLGRIPNSRVLRWKYTEKTKLNLYALFGNAEVQQRG